MAADFAKYRSAFKSFSIVMDIALTLPLSTAKVESCVSSLTQILRPQRLSMTQKRKSELMLMAFNRDITSCIDLDKFVELFALVSRKISL